jgi:hypothetical protein
MESGSRRGAAPRSRARAGGVIAALALALGLGIAGCGGSGSSAIPSAGTGTNAADPEAQSASECMRAHGVRNFPDPVKGSGGVGLSVAEQPGSSAVTVDGIPFSGPAFTAAAKTCGFGPGNDGHARLSAAQRRGMLENAECMRRHGVPNFPDPTFGPRGGVKGAASSGIDVNTPAFVRANQICNRVGVPLPGGG